MQVSSDKLMQILSMGITQNVDDISTALLCTNNNVDQAVSWLFANMSSKPAARPANSEPNRPVPKPKRFCKTKFGDGEILEESFTEMTLGFEWGKLFYPKGNNNVGQLKKTKQRFKKDVITDSPNNIYLFGDNDIDFNRTNPEREYSGGMAKACGPFDRSRCYGIMTTFYGSQKPELEEFKDIMTRQFEDVRKFIAHGLDIIVPEPNIADLSGFYAKNYHKNGNQVITHNLGTGMAMLSQDHLLVIETFLNDISREEVVLADKSIRVEPSGVGEVPADLKASIIAKDQNEEAIIAKDQNETTEEDLQDKEEYDMMEEEVDGLDDK